MVGTLHRSAAWRGAFLTLAVLALMLKVSVPTGFMVGPSNAGTGFALEICTGHGPLISGAPDHKGGETKGKADAPCAFSGQATAPAPSVDAPLIGSIFTQAAQHASALGVDLAPGRGLAAPPPPSQGPPARLV